MTSLGNLVSSAAQRACLGAGVALVALLGFAGAGPAQADVARDAPPHPFSAGENLTYRIQVARMGTVGRGSMTVEGPVDVRGRETLLLRFDVRTRVGPVRAVDHTESWLDPARMASMRFYKHERHPLSKFDEFVELFPDERRWESADGRSGPSPSDAPLDELSFIYFLRTLPLESGASYRFDRHFEPGRNPISLRVLARERITVPGGEFDAVLVEMRVRDPRRYKNADGVLRIHLSDDECRLPLRIQSSLPVFGAMTLSLESNSQAGPCAVRRST